MENDCSHKLDEEGYCMKCGLECHQIPFYDEKKSFEVKIPVSIGKFTIKNKEYILDKTIKQILQSFGILEHSGEIKKCLKNHKFTGKVSLENKILLILYNLSKATQFPLTLNDILKYSTYKKHKFLKVYRDNFKFLKNGTLYIRKVYDRAMHTCINEFEAQQTDVFESCLLCIANFPSADIFTICILKIIQNQKNKNRKMKFFVSKKHHLYDKIKDL
ncbi:hypothetical protein NUSPORA_00020 [Nucleospora cyclopteri]